MPLLWLSLAFVSGILLGDVLHFPWAVWLGLGIATLAAWLVITRIMEARWSLHPEILVATAAVGLAVTVAFGARNLRPRPAALVEIARVLRPGGTLSVLEASAPAPGPLHGPHAFWVRHVIPLAGRFSPDPSAYRYLSESIFEFGAGPEFERDLAGAGLEVAARRSFLFGATRLWVARRGPAVGQYRAAAPAIVRNARSAGAALPAPASPPATEADLWRMAQAALAGALTLALGWALRMWINVNAHLPLTTLQRIMGWALLLAGLGLFATRCLWLLLRISAGARGR